MLLQDVAIATHLSELVYRAAEFTGEALQNAKTALDAQFPSVSNELSQFSVHKAGEQR